MRRRSCKKIDVETAVEYRRRLFEKTGLAVTADRSDDNLTNLEGMDGGFSFIDADSTPQPLEGVLPTSPAPADEEHPPGSSDDEDDSKEERGERNSGANDELATLDVDDDFDEGEELLPLKVPTVYILANSAPSALTTELVLRPILLRLGIGWLKGTITRQAQARPHHLHGCRDFATVTAAHAAGSCRCPSTRRTARRGWNVGRCWRALLCNSSGRGCPLCGPETGYHSVARTDLA